MTRDKSQTSENRTQNKTQYFSFLDGFISVFVLGIIWLKHGEWLKMFIGLTTTIVAISVFVMLGQEYVFIPDTPWWYAIILGILVFGAAMVLLGFVNGPFFYDKFIRQRSFIIGIVLVLAWIGVVMVDADNRSELIGGLEQLVSQKPTIDDWMTKVFGSVKPLYYFIFCLASFVFIGSIATYEEDYSKSTSKDRLLLQSYLRKSSRAKFIFVLFLIFLVLTAFADPKAFSYLNQSAGNWPKLMSVNLLSSFSAHLVVVLITLFVADVTFKSIFTYYPNGPTGKEGEKHSRVPGTGLLGLFTRVILASMLLLSVLGFFKSSSIYNQVSELLSPDFNKGIYTNSKNMGEKALENGDFQKAKEEFGYAAAAAGGSGNLDELENMLNQLETAKNQR